MSPTQETESVETKGTPGPQVAVILILDFNTSVELAERLEWQLRAMTVPPTCIHSQCLRGRRVPEATKEMLETVADADPDLVILMLSDETQAHEPDIFRALLGRKRSPPILVIPGSEEPNGINHLLQLGASDYLLPPFRPADIQPRIQRLLAFGREQQTPIAALKEALGLKQFVGESPMLMEQVQRIPRMARCDACVLITGETGTGKEVCARTIHYLSPRVDQPFVPINCGAIPIDLLENELFGHEAGAYTSASTSHSGVISEANGGTLFLDEIDSLPLSAQIKLLRFLHDQEYRPLGARKAVKADVRIIAASNGNMDELLGSGRFRQDLFYRLNVLPLRLPPLRQRKEDIPLLARHFVAKYVAKTDGHARDIAPAALQRLSLHDWPGNVRELENVIERAVMLSTNEVIRSNEIDLPNSTEPDLELKSFALLKANIVAEFERCYQYRRYAKSHCDT